MKQILIVDDQEENIYYLRSLMEANGWATATAVNGAEALAMARLNPPNLIISDLLMPVMDGYALLREWKQDPKLKNIKFIVYTATYTGRKDEDFALSLGADAFLIKPQEPEVLLAHIVDVQSTAFAAVPRPTEVSVANENISLKLYSESLIRQLELANQTLLRDQAELLMRDRAIGAASQGILITDPRQPDNPIVFSNAGFAKLSGYNVEESQGRNCRFLQGKATDPGTVTQLQTAIALAQKCEVEILNYRKDGTSFWNHLDISPVKDEAGVLTHFVGVQTDVTARRKLEGDLRQSQKMEAFGSLAGGVAHDFNNILATIGLICESIREKTESDGPIRKGLDSIMLAQNRGAGLTRQLLAFSRKQAIDSKPLDVDLTIDSMMVMLRRLIGENIELESRKSAEAKFILADAGQIEQIVMNLVLNARDAIDTAGKIMVSTEAVDLKQPAKFGAREAPAGAYIQIKVTDSGCGISEADMSQIFDPFFTTKETGKGTGLGLSTVHGIVSSNKGYIDVESRHNQGTTFKILFPVTDLRPLVTPPGVKSAGKKVANQTILLAEDQTEFREVLATILRASGYSVLTAENGEEALKIYQDNRSKIDMLITDVVMPKMDGRKLSENVHELTPGIKVLFLSGYTEDSLLKLGISGMNSQFLDKPFSANTILSKIDQILNTQPPIALSN